MPDATPSYHDELAEYCRAQGIRWLATYDAAIVRRNYPGADLFMLVEFEAGHKVGREFFKMERQLTGIIGGVCGDLKALPELADYYRDEILSSVTVRFASETATHLPQMLADARESWAATEAAERQAVRDKVKAVPPEKLAELCRKNGIKWLAACDVDLAPNNYSTADLMLVVEYEKGHPKGWGSFDEENELAALYDVVKVYLITPSALRYRKSEVLASARVQFAA